MPHLSTVLTSLALLAASQPPDPTKPAPPLIEAKHWRLVLKPENPSPSRPPGYGERPPRGKPPQPEVVKTPQPPPIRYFLVEYRGRVVARANSTEEVVAFAKKYLPAFPAAPWDNNPEPAERPFQKLANLVAASWGMPGAAAPDKETLEQLRNGDRFARNVYTTHREMLKGSKEYRERFERKLTPAPGQGK